jgi:hypothetical protein
MKSAMIALLLAISAGSTFAADRSASSCLAAAGAKECLAGVALAALAKDKSAESRVDGYASLLSSLAKAGVQRDDVFAAGTDDESAPIDSRWSLAVARRTYALRFDTGDAGVDDPARIEAMATLLRGRRDGLERLMVIWAGCEAREGGSLSALEKWDGVLDRLCRMDGSDAEALEKDFPGMSAMAAPVVDAYNRDDQALRRSLVASLDTLSRYESALSGKMSGKDREGIHGILGIGHLLNATALATAGYQQASAKAVDVCLGHLRKAPTIGKILEFHTVETLASWIYAKAGMRDEAMKAVRESLSKADRIRNGSGGGKATTIATAIETLRVLESTR